MGIRPTNVDVVPNDERRVPHEAAHWEATLFGSVAAALLPRFEDYLYVAMTNGIAFSPTDAMPLTLSAKRLMALESLISVAAVLVIAARAVNVIGS